MSFFQGFYEKDGTYIGVGSKKHAPNCYCAEHDQPTEERTETTEMTKKENTGEPIPSEPEQSIPKDTTPIQPRESETQTAESSEKKKRLIPWGFG